MPRTLWPTACRRRTLCPQLEASLPLLIVDMVPPAVSFHDALPYPQLRLDSHLYK